MQVLPAILANDADELRSQLLFPGLEHCATAMHIDILDGSLFGTSCFADPKVVATWGKLPPIELHVMTLDPMKHIEAWHKHIPSLQRAIVHLEVGRRLRPTLEAIGDLRLERGLAISPDSHVDEALPFSALLDRLLVMGVIPGKAGQAFLGEPILAKLRRAHHLFPGISLALDGGVTHENAQMIAEAGADALVAGSAIWRHPHPVRACEQLVHSNKPSHDS
ncbi:MAG: hypothetical protein NUV56_00865 [Candidatus Uhrbacteria bacterium]|nr:hypothetical protein [Candidatus Uhrbacteria bacterium]